ncbi:MAG: MutT/NUDIX family protein [candidate division CPR2 bacterium GW2011_GWC1_39_9]|uniref:MutT/NUDIX family protein n=1 Tax=candidate division CPR2 bacterium GW2011_GWC2_39_10 TaxID=1618345 RepID=A0A0G0P6C2_UNCC2|nr:MAG: MutT/NUDIX family protein [candidate division CPR2 bacterium GW2011_GWC2_39_10]KKR34179.1 MAG: MutT/NUDIX family protein [candidate division CPR2 bacterium GW2011_GWC1_39_9]
MKKGVDYTGVGVCTVIVNNNGEIFLGKRGRDSRNQIGFWSIPGGGVRFGEKLAEAITREVKEEHDISIELLEQLPAIDHLILSEKQHWVTTPFVAKIKNGQTPKIMEQNKCDEIGWFTLNNLPKPHGDASANAIKNYKKYYLKNN